MGFLGIRVELIVINIELAIWKRCLLRTHAIFTNKTDSRLQLSRLEVLSQREIAIVINRPRYVNRGPLGPQSIYGGPMFIFIFSSTFVAGLRLDLRLADWRYNKKQVNKLESSSPTTPYPISYHISFSYTMPITEQIQRHLRYIFKQQA